METTTETAPRTTEQIIETVNKEIALRNKLFRGKTNAEKRVLIAKDIINQVKIGRIIAKSQSFYEQFWAKSPEIMSERNSIQASLLCGDIEKCNCCALGSLMVSTTLFNNKENLSDVIDFEYLGSAINENKKFKNDFHRIFGKAQLKLIEHAFERGEGFFQQDLDWTAIGDKAIDFGNEYEDNKDRLLAIMENIIKNKGTFKP